MGKGDHNQISHGGRDKPTKIIQNPYLASSLCWDLPSKHHKFGLNSEYLEMGHNRHSRRSNGGGRNVRQKWRNEDAIAGFKGRRR